MLSTTARIYAGALALTLVWNAAPATAGTRHLARAVLLGWASSAQLAEHSSEPTDNKALADDLLRRARQAISENDLQAAESLVARAEGLGVSYGPFHLGDTPKRVRRDLERSRSRTESDSAPQSRLPAPFGFGADRQPAPSADPFAGRLEPADQAAGVAGSEASFATPPLARFGAGGSSPAAGPAAPDSAPEDQQAGARGEALSLLHGARRALAVGDVRRAHGMAQQARNIQAQFAPGDDTPAQVEAAAEQYEALLSDRRPTESWRRAYARMLVGQAQALLRYGDFDEAERLADEAARPRVAFNPTETDPQTLLEQIAAARRGRPGVGSHVAGTPGPDVPAEKAARARELVRQARQALNAGQHAQADQLAREAESLGLPDAAFEPGELPAMILLDVRTARLRSVAGASGVVAAGAEEVVPAAGRLEPGHTASHAVYDPSRDRTRNIPASATATDYGPGTPPRSSLAQSGPIPPAPGMPMVPAPPADTTAAGEPRETVGMSLFRQGEEALRAHDVERAYQFFQQAARYRHELDPITAQRLQDHLQLLSAPGAAPPADTTAAGEPRETVGMSLFRQGEEALRAHDVERAYQFFQQAARYRHELDPITAQRLQDHLQLLSAPGAGRPATPPAGAGESMLSETAVQQQVLARQVSADVAHQVANARALREKDPQQAEQLLEQTRQKVEASGLEPGARAQVLRRIERELADLHQFLEQNRPRLELEERNAQVREEVVRRQRVVLEIQEKLAMMVDEYNRLMDEQRFAEAEVVAKRAAELDPHNPIVQQLLWQSKFVRRFMRNKALREAKEESFVEVLDDVEWAAVQNVGDENPLVFGDVRRWEEITGLRARYRTDHRRQRSERELEIEQKLRTPVTADFTNAPLSQVLDYLARLADINIHVDPQGLAEEGVRSDSPVTIHATHDIMLKSALNLILEQLHLGYVIQDEVLKITSAQLRDGEIYTVTYNVADLVVPIPNFVPSPRMGLAGAYHDALGQAGYGGFGPLGPGAAPLAVLASKDGQEASGVINPAVLAQRSGPQAGAMPGSMPLGFGPGGLGGGTQADFDSLIELITSTVQPQTWTDMGGPGSIAPFETNLSIVVSHTQEVHEEIVDLLEQLRRLQDLQVTIEVRFITLNDNFFERIGVDFDFDIDDNIDRPGMGFGRIVAPGAPPGLEPARNTLDFDNRGNDQDSVTVGLSAGTDAGPVFSADLDIPFRQNTFGLSAPQFGGFDPSAGASIGFAILSDIEAFFFIQAAQGDRRSNVLQAPKVTLFNGQLAFVSDTSQSPFVISVIPVVGDFAAAQQPVVVVLSEGTFLTVQAVVSNDRRFVRLTVVPFFSRIGDDVRTFQFTGTETTTTDTSAEGWVNPANADDRRRTNNNNQATVTRSGTTVQLPTFSFISVTTTVSVPDGGTVLLGGIKRLSEGRNEFGVPMLNKVPYLNRLFKNVGIGRETQSLMMMVTPRIIIQEEEEERLGIVAP